MIVYVTQGRRKTSRETAEGRRVRKDAIASPVLLEMSLGRPEACLEPAQTATVAANQCGFTRKQLEEQELW